jgi:hypothetical protein
MVMLEGSNGCGGWESVEMRVARRGAWSLAGNSKRERARGEGQGRRGERGGGPPGESEEGRNQATS